MSSSASASSATKLLSAIGRLPVISCPPSACQAVGAAVAWLGWNGLLVPCVRAHGSSAVILVDLLSPGAAYERIGEQDIASTKSIVPQPEPRRRLRTAT
jgi:hypothetical protein